MASEPVERRRYRFATGRNTTLDASGGGTLTVGPSDVRGPATWDVDGVILRTSRPGQAPIPRAEVYVDRIAPDSLQGITYDGSFAPGTCTFTITRGQRVIVVWTGGQAGDDASVSLTGWKY